jgi:hypothetical protein
MEYTIPKSLSEFIFGSFDENLHTSTTCRPWNISLDPKTIPKDFVQTRSLSLFFILKM